MHDSWLFCGTVWKQTLWLHPLFSNTVQNILAWWLFPPLRSLHCLFASVLIFENLLAQTSQSYWPRWGGSAVAHFLELHVRIPPGAWMSLSCDCCLLSGRGLCVGLITHPEESYWMLCVSLGVIAEHRHWRGRDQIGPSRQNVQVRVNFQ
jgi:hypothetical protein